MNAYNVLSFFYNIEPLKSFIQKITIECSVNPCIATTIKKGVFSKDSLAQNAEALNTQLSALFDANTSYFDLISSILLEFHFHETTHCKRSEVFSLYKQFFPFNFELSCQHSKTLELFPSISLKLPEFRDNLPKTRRLFQGLFSSTSQHQIANCGCVKQYSIKSCPEVFIILTEGLSQSLLNFFASVPSAIKLSDFAKTENEKDFIILGFLMAEGPKVSFFANKGKLTSWETGQVHKRKKVSFTDGVLELINSGALPLALVYAKSDQDLFIELENFSVIETMNLKTVANQESADFVKKAEARQSWTCKNCSKIVRGKTCSCSKSNYWKCVCKKINFEETCACGVSMPVCTICKNLFSFYQDTCRRCGDRLGAEGNCGLCGLDVKTTCKDCYREMVACDICGWINDFNKVGCMRCMNPLSIHLKID